MNRTSRPLPSGAVLLTVATTVVLISMAGLGCNNGGEKGPGKAKESVQFGRDIKPILSKKCVPCHNSETISGRLNLESRRTAFGGSENGSFIVPGEPDASLIYSVTAKAHGDGGAVPKMPELKGVFLKDEERAKLRKWIESGANWPGGDEGWLKPPKERKGEV